MAGVLSKKTKKRAKLFNLWCKFAEVNEDGVSRVVTAEEIYKEYQKESEFKPLWWVKEGPRRHGAFRGGNSRMIELSWDFVKHGSKIVSIQSTGWNQNYISAELKANRPIRPDIREWHIKNFPYCTLCCEDLERLKGKIVIDHKDDSYSDPNVCGNAAFETQKKEDFQISCEGCNRRKDLYKQRWPEWRPPPGHYLQMGCGDYFIDENGVKREYWYDGEAYRKYWKNKN